MKRHINEFLKGNEGTRIQNTTKLKKDKVDWSIAFKEAKDQGQCGSCWAFATVGAVESNWWMNNQSKDKVYFSTQQLVDCNKENGGCHGGDTRIALEYVKNEELLIDSAYPYTAQDGQYNIPEAEKYKIEDFKYCQGCSIDDWYGLLSFGPVAIFVDADQLMSYKGEIVKLENCKELNHAIVAYDWDSSDGGDVISIRNSWTTDWKENGNMKVFYEQAGNTCIITDTAYLPIF